MEWEYYSAGHVNQFEAVLVADYFQQGLIQSVFELHDGSGVVITVGKYVTPKHRDINGNGIEPDFQNFPGKKSPLFSRNGNRAILI